MPKFMVPDWSQKYNWPRYFSKSSMVVQFFFEIEILEVF